jgi:hypothetical protein
MATEMMFYALKSHLGQCWVEAGDPEHALSVFEKHYGMSATPEFCRNDDDEPVKCKRPPSNMCYLGSDAKWRQNDGAPMLSRRSNFLMCLGASYQEALADEMGDKTIIGMLDARNKAAARKRSIESACKAAEKLSADGRVLTDYSMDDLLRSVSIKDATQEERLTIRAAYESKAETK